MKDNEFENGSTEMQPESNEISVKEDQVEGPPEEVHPANKPGTWRAWDEERERILAWADTFPKLVELIEQKGLGDPHVDTAPGFPPGFFEEAAKLIDDESSNILTDVYKIIPDAEQWLDTPNDHFGLKTPRELVGTVNEWQLRFMLRRVRYVCYS